MATQLRDSQINSQRITDLQSKDVVQDQRLDSLELDMTAAETNITALQTQTNTDHQALTTTQSDLDTLEAEVTAARGGKADLKAYIDSRGGSAQSDFKILSAVQQTTDVIVTVEAGRASVNGTLVESGASQTFLVSNATLNSTYHVSLQQTGVVTVSTVAVPASWLYLGDVVIGPSLANIQVVDKRAFLTLGGGAADNTEVVNARQGFATLDARLDDADARIVTVTQEVTGARAGHESLDARLNGMTLSSGSISFTEDFATKAKVDLIRTDALVDTVGARVAKGTTYIDEFDTAVKVDSVNSSTTIVVDTVVGEARMARTVTSATLSTIPVTTTNTNYVSLVTQETHETILAAQPYTQGDATNTDRFCSIVGPGGRIWTFDAQTNGTVSVQVTDVNGSIIRSRIAVMSVTPSGTLIGAPRAFVVGTKVGVIVFSGGTTTGNAFMRTLQTDFSDIASQQKSSLLTAVNVGNPAALDNWIDAKVDANNRIWIVVGGYNTGNPLRFAILEQDGTKFLDWTNGPIASTVANSAQWSPSLQLLSTGEMALSWMHSTPDTTRGSVLAVKCYLAVYNSVGTLLRGPVILIQGEYALTSERFPSPAMVEVPSGTLQVFVQTTLGISRVAVTISSLAITYRKATNLTEDVVPYGAEAAGTLVPGASASNGRGGVYIRPTQDVQLHDFGVLYTNTSGASYTPTFYLFRKDGPTFNLLFQYVSSAVATGTTTMAWMKSGITAILESGKEYFLATVLSTNLGPAYVDTTGGPVNLDWAQVEPGMVNPAGAFVTMNYRVPMTIVIGRNYDLVTRTWHDYEHLSAAYDQVANKVSVCYSGSNGQFGATPTTANQTDYTNMVIAQFKTSDWSLYDKFFVESTTAGNSSGYLLPTSSDQFVIPFHRVSAIKNLFARVTALTTSISYQVTVDGGTTWKSITPGGGSVFFPITGTSLIMRTTLTAPRVGATPHLLRYELQQWQAIAFNVAAGRAYTPTPAPSSTYTDTGGTELTDGYLPSNANSPYDSGWTGWQSVNPVLVFDLGATEKLMNVRIFAGSQSTAGILYPIKILTEASADNATWVQVGNTSPGVADSGGSNMITAWLQSNLNGQSYRYVRITVTEGSGTTPWVFLGEVQINVDRAGSAPAQTASFYSTVLPSRLPAARASITADTVTNGGTITFLVTNDGGVTWWPVTLGVPVVFDNWDGSDVRIKATLSSPAGLALSPVLRRYTIITSDLVSAGTVDRRLAAREIDYLKLALEVEVLSGASKHRLSSTVVDTFNDIVGVDSALSIGQQYNGAQKSVRAADPVAGATIISTPDIVSGTPIRIFFVAEDQLNSGSINYYVSRDNGATWSLITSGALLDVSGQPTGNTIRAKAVISGAAEVLGWGWGWY